MEELLRPCIWSRYISRFPALFRLMCLLRGWCVFVRACVCVNLRCYASVSRFGQSSSSSSFLLLPAGVHTLPPPSPYSPALPLRSSYLSLLRSHQLPFSLSLSLLRHPFPPCSPHWPLLIPLPPSPSLCFVLQVLVSRQAWESLAASSIFTVSVGRHKAARKGHFLRVIRRLVSRVV